MEREKIDPRKPFGYYDGDLNPRVDEPQPEEEEAGEPPQIEAAETGRNVSTLLVGAGGKEMVDGFVKALERDPEAVRRAPNNLYDQIVVMGEEPPAQRSP